MPPRAMKMRLQSAREGDAQRLLPVWLPSQAEPNRLGSIQQRRACCNEPLKLRKLHRRKSERLHRERIARHDDARAAILRR